MKFIKENIKLLIVFLIGMLISGGIVYAVTSASDVVYTREGTDIKSVADALNDLYNKNNSEFKLIWENANSSNDFNDQTIDYDLSKYNYVLIKTAYSKSYTGYYPETQYSLIAVGESNAHILAPDDNCAYHSARTVTVTNSGISFSKAYTFGFNLNSNSNSVAHAIPLMIYAIK